MDYRNKTPQPTDAVTRFRQVHAEVWNLLPWYVNGTLDDKERRLVDQHVSQCLACRTELSEQRAIARYAAETDVLDSVMETSLAKMHERLAAEGADMPPAAKAPSRAEPTPAPRWATGRQSLRQRWERFRSALRFRPMAIGVMGGVPAMALVALLIFDPATAPPQPFTTLSDGELELAGPVLRVQVAGEADTAAFATLLADEGLRIIDGPSPYGVYTVSPITGDLSQAEATADRLRDAAFVDFVTVVAP